jgi:hypothetical protein
MATSLDHFFSGPLRYTSAREPLPWWAKHAPPPPLCVTPLPLARRALLPLIGGSDGSVYHD